MWRQAQKISFVLFLLAISTSGVIGRSGVLVKKFQNCDPTADYDFKLNVSIISSENKQYIDGIIILKSPFDNNLMSNVSMEILTGNKYVHVLSVTERKSCEAVHKYFGEFAYDLERQVQLIPGMCPLPKGKHQFHNLLLNYRQIPTLATIPFGNLRIIDIITMRNNSIYGCFIAEVENYPYF